MEKPTRDQQIAGILSTLGMVVLVCAVWAWSKISAGIWMHRPVPWQQVLWWGFYVVSGIIVLWVLLTAGIIGYYYFFKPGEFWGWDKTSQQWRNRHDKKGSAEAG